MRALLKSKLVRNLGYDIFLKMVIFHVDNLSEHFRVHNFR
jgi:hypothetical protein